MDEHELVEVMRAARRLTAWAESVELSAIAELDRRRQAQADRYGSWTVEMSRAECDEVSAALTVSGTAAAIRLGMAIALEQTLPDTRRALAEGRIDGAKARVICDGVIGITTELAQKVEALVLPDAPRLTSRQLAARVRKAVFDADPQAFERRRKAAEKGRRLEQYTNSDGTSDLAARDLPADAADAAYDNVNTLATALKREGDERPIDAIRADVALELMRGKPPAELSPVLAGPTEPAPAADASAHESRRSEPNPTDSTADRTSGADNASGAGDNATHTTSGNTGNASGPGGTERREAAAIARTVREELTALHDKARDLNRPQEHRLLIEDAARRITDALAPLKIRRCHITTSDGDLVHGHDGYRVPAGMRHLIQARNGTCTFPTCRRDVAQCDLDHTVPFHRDGPTCPCNLAPLCRGHHRLKQHPDWTLIQLWPGVLLWIAPTGHWYLVGPDP